MTAGPSKANGATPGRAGAQALSLLAVPFNAVVVKTLAAEPKSLLDLRRQTGSPPQTTMRARLRALAKAGVVEKRRRKEFAGTVDYQLTAAGHELLAVAEVLSAWLAASPEGPTTLGSGSARSAIKALVEGWTTSMVRALAVRPLSLTELNSVIPSLTYPSLERRLAAMRAVGQVKPLNSGSRVTPYAVTDWMRRAVAPLGAAARWERRRLSARAAPVTNRDAEAAFLLVLPLLHLPSSISGSCRLAVQMQNGASAGIAGVVAQVGEGSVISCETGVEADTDASALGSSGAWLAAVIEHDVDALELHGNSRLATNLVEGMHKALFDGGAQDGYRQIA